MIGKWKSHPRRCEHCLALFDCHNERQWICDPCQEKRQQLKLPHPIARNSDFIHTGWGWGIRNQLEFGKKREAIRKWARQK